MGNGHLLHLELPILCGHDSHGDLLVKATSAAASGIEPKDAVPFLTGVLMGVAIDIISENKDRKKEYSMI